MTEETICFYTHLFEQSFKHDILWLSVLWHENTPIAALICFVEHYKQSILAYMIGHDDNFEKLKPGKILYGYSIKDAIEQGMRVYDLGRGNYDYKYEFGSQESFNTNIWITPNNLQSNCILAIWKIKIYLWQELKKNEFLRKIKHTIFKK